MRAARIAGIRVAYSQIHITNVQPISVNTGGMRLMVDSTVSGVVGLRSAATAPHSRG